MTSNPLSTPGMAPGSSNLMWLRAKWLFGMATHHSSLASHAHRGRNKLSLGALVGASWRRSCDSRSFVVSAYSRSEYARVRALDLGNGAGPGSRSVALINAVPESLADVRATSAVVSAHVASTIASFLARGGVVRSRYCLWQFSRVS